MSSSITIIGTGNMAGTIGTLAVAGGNTVEVIGRDRAKADALTKTLGGGTTTGTWGAVPAGDVVIAALLADGIVPVVTEFGRCLIGKAVVDISNPFNATADGLSYAGETSIAQQAQDAAAAGVHLVKGFNTIFAGVLEKGRPAVFIAGDDAQAKAKVATFIESLGLRARDVGDLTMAHWLEGAGLLTMGLAANGVGHWDFALGVDEFHRLTAGEARPSMAAIRVSDVDREVTTSEQAPDHMLVECGDPCGSSVALLRVAYRPARFRGSSATLRQLELLRRFDVPPCRTREGAQNEAPAGAFVNVMASGTKVRSRARHAVPRRRRPM